MRNSIVLGRFSIRRTALPVALGSLFACTAPSLAHADPNTNQCVDQNATGQRLRRDALLLRARDAFRLCAEAACPALVRDDCAKRLDEVERALPTIAFAVHDSTGADVATVHVSMDGAPWADSLEGKAISVDPGRHVFLFRADGYEPTTRRVVLTEGEKGRREQVELPGNAPLQGSPGAGVTSLRSTTALPSMLATDSAAGPASPRVGGVGIQRIVGLTLGLGGVAALVVGGIFGGLATSAWNQAKSDCGGNPNACTDVIHGQSDRNAALTDATVSTVGLIVGGTLLAGGAIVFFTAPAHDVERATRLTVAPEVGAHGGAVMLNGGF